MPPEKELDRQIIVVIGAGAGIGKATAHRLVKEGAHIVCVDLDEASAKETAQEIIAKYGAGHRRRRHRHQQLRPGHRSWLRHHQSRKRRRKCSAE